jgi:DNA-directed RNA polymerase specialized sigma24 family protein
VCSANVTPPSEPDCLAELAVILGDPQVRRLVRRWAGELYEDVLQETWYAVAKACERRRIDNLRGYFCQVLINMSRRTHQQRAREPLAVDDPDQAVSASVPRGGPRPGSYAPPADDAALRRLGVAVWLRQLRADRARLADMIPGRSDDPARYREIILALAESLLTGDGPATQAEINQALTDAYPRWFGPEGSPPATVHQRLCRARKSLRLILAEVVSREDLRP